MAFLMTFRFDYILLFSVVNFLEKVWLNQVDLWIRLLHFQMWGAIYPQVQYCKSKSSSLSCLATETIFDCGSNWGISVLSNILLLKTISAQTVLGWTNWRILRNSFVFSVSVYYDKVYLHYRLHKHAVRPSLMQLYYH